MSYTCRDVMAYLPFVEDARVCFMTGSMGFADTSRYAEIQSCRAIIFRLLTKQDEAMDIGEGHRQAEGQVQPGEDLGELLGAHSIADRLSPGLRVVRVKQSVRIYSMAVESSTSSPF